MEIRDPIHGSIEISAAETRVIDTPLFQRLRQIKQMGFADQAFPGATHTRYLHSIGAMWMAERAFASIFRHHHFERPGLGAEFLQLVRLGALLHDIGHAPLSHCTEFAMPLLRALDIPCYAGLLHPEDRRATHEDYTIKILTDSSLTRVLERSFPRLEPLHLAALVNLALPIDNHFFVDGGVNYRTLLAQIISSELDVDRMDYLRRDSYFAGVSYGNYDYNWITGNLTFYVHPSGSAHLALDPRAIYAFNDFLISRYHMFLMVYFHHKSVIYEEMLKKYFQSTGSSYAIPADIDAYVEVDDYQLYHHLRQAAREGHPWAQRLIGRDAYRRLHEMHGVGQEIDLSPIVEHLERAGIDVIASSSMGDMSRYTKPGEKRRRAPSIYVFEKDSTSLGRRRVAQPLEECTDLFARYEKQRHIARIYVAPEVYEQARSEVTSFLEDGNTLT